MPLRTLLGYEPRAVSRQREDWNNLAYADSRQVMATKKQRYQAPMARVKKLPPIDEEGLGGSGHGSPRIHGRHEAVVRRLPKNVFRETDDDFFSKIDSPGRRKPVLTVQPMRRQERRHSPVDDLKKDYLNAYKPMVKQSDVVSPRDVNHTIVDGLVADYLHYARYGHVIPVYEGTSSNTCPCCTDRNRENVRTLLGFPKGSSGPTAGGTGAAGSYERPNKYDHISTVRNSKDEKELASDSSMYPNSLYSNMRRQKAKQAQMTPDEIRLQTIADESRKGAWVNYQPLPYATNYLNPEFNRPAELNSLYNAESHNANLYMKHKVLEANSNFDNAMSKLGGFRFDGSTQRY